MPGVSWSTLRQAVSLSRQGKHSEALAEANNLLKDSPTEVRFYYQAALIQLEADRPEEALATLDKAPGPATPVLFLYRSLTLGQLERWTEALDQANKLKEVSPDHQFLASLMCYLHLGAGQVAEAIKPLQVDKPLGWITWFRPELAGFSPLLSRLLLQVESYLLPLEFPELRLGEALNDPVTIDTPPQKISLKALSNSIGGYLQQRRGLHYWEKGLTTNDPKKRHVYLEKNLSAQRRAVELEPLQFRGYYHLGEALLYSSTPPDQQLPLRDRLEEAEKCFVHSWKQEGGNPYLYFYLGRTVQLLGQPLAAKTYLEKALEKFEKFPEAHYALGQLHLLMGEPVQAREWLKKSVSSDFLPVARERLYEIWQALEQGKLAQRPTMPLWPPPLPEGSDPKDESPEPVQTDAIATEATAESRQSEDPPSLPENRETSPSEPAATEPDSPSTPPVAATD